MNRTDVTPGMIVTVQTFGELAHWHPHVHTIVTDGVFTPEGVFVPFLEMVAEPFLKLWEAKVFNLLLDHNKISQDIVDQMRHWKHSGFSVTRMSSLLNMIQRGLKILSST